MCDSVQHSSHFSDEAEVSATPWVVGVAVGCRSTLEDYLTKGYGKPLNGIRKNVAK